MQLTHAPRGRQDPWTRRMLGLTAVAATCFVCLLGQLWYLQVLEGAKLRDMSDKNRTRIRPVAAPRGILYDRNGLALVDNRPAFTLSFIPRDMDDRNSVLARVAVLLKIPLAELQEALGRVPADSLRPVRVRRGLSLEDVAKIEEWKIELPGVVVEVEPQRVYPTNSFAAHLLGYVREVSESRRAGAATAGRHGRADRAERLLDEYLRGATAASASRSTLGRPIQVIQREEARPGGQVITTIAGASGGGGTGDDRPRARSW
jgi:penicillin-binding protein 2